MVDVSSPAKDPSSMKKAAAYLLRGGTLTSEQCDSCGGPLVKFEEKMLCANCGLQRDVMSAAPQAQKSPKASGAVNPAQTERPRQPMQGLDEAISSVAQKIRELAAEAAGERDSAVLREKGELIRLYLEILAKMRDVAGQ
ncbi:MAG: Sjogren's syndrome/scleroderma autoantigen 1 family protein [Nitrososphaera sp.]|jgi:uncharacterized Zn finger protein (UPF0148 family)